MSEHDIEVDINGMMVMMEKRLVAEKEAGNKVAKFLFEDDELIKGALNEVKETYSSKGWSMEFETTADGILVSVKDF